MSETPGRGYLPPTVPAPGAHRRQWPPPMMPAYFGGQWQPSAKPFTTTTSVAAAAAATTTNQQPDGIVDLTSSTNTINKTNEHNGEQQQQQQTVTITATGGGGGNVNGQIKEIPAVSVIAPNPLVQSDIEQKDERRQPQQQQQHQLENKMAPIPYPVDYNKGHPVHPHTNVKLEVGIPPLIESKGVPAESKGTPSHPVESKVPAVVVVANKTEPKIETAIMPSTPQSTAAPAVPIKTEDLLPSSGAGGVSNITATTTTAATPITTAVPTVLVATSSPKTQISTNNQQQQQQSQPQPPADHVESLLENMFQGDAESPIKASVIVTNATRTPVLTEDKVVRNIICFMT